MKRVKAIKSKRTTNPETLTDRAYRTIEERIVTLKIRPGAIIGEAQLSKQIGIGRTPVREALQRLAREGLVMVLPRRGIVVTEVSPVSQLRLLEVRREVERLIARQASRLARPEQRERLIQIATEMELVAKSDREIDFLRLDQEMNFLLLSAARNEFAEAAMVPMHGLSRRFWYIHWCNSADLLLTATLHGAIARAVANSIPEAAAAALDNLMDYLEEFTRSTVFTQNP